MLETQQAIKQVRLTAWKYETWMDGQIMKCRIVAKIELRGTIEEYEERMGVIWNILR